VLNFFRDIKKQIIPYSGEIDNLIFQLIEIRRIESNAGKSLENRSHIFNKKEFKEAYKYCKKNKITKLIGYELIWL